MFGGLEGTQEELMFIDDKMYPRRKIDTIKKLMEELDEDDLREYLIQDILKPRKQRKRRAKPQSMHMQSQEPLQQLEEMFAELEPVNKIVDFKSPAQKEFAVSEAIKEAKKRGRKPKYSTEEERKQAKREKTIASNKKRREEKKHEISEEEEFPISQILEPAGKKKNKKVEEKTTRQIIDEAKAQLLEASKTAEESRQARQNKGSGLKHILKTKLGESVRGSVVAEYMKKHNVPLGVASRMVKQLGLY
jgi:hypothetical protein